MNENSTRAFRLTELAASADSELRWNGASDVSIIGVCALAPGYPNRLTFATAGAGPSTLAATQAAVVVTSADQAEHCQTAVLVSETPQRTFAHIARLFEPPPPVPGCHAAAVVADSAEIAADAAIAAGAVIGCRTTIGAGCVVAANAVIDDDACIAANTHIGAGARIGARTRIGANSTIGPNAVLGARGFGLVANEDGYEPMPQLGAVRLGDEVEIGAGATIDRGAIDDTVVGDGTKIDNQVHIGHNCVIGAHTVICGCVGLAGSVRIGEFCMLGGGSGIADHVNIADGTMITGATQVARDIDTAGVYSSGMWAMPAPAWRRCMALFRGLGNIERRLRRIEKNRKPS